LKINVVNIPEEGLKIHFSREGNWLTGIVPGREKGIVSVDRIDVTGGIRRLRKTIFLEGQIDTTVEMDCSRCLEMAHLPVHVRFNYTFVPVQEEQAEDVELSAEDLDYVYYQDDLIDLDPLIFEQVMLQIPMKVLCREDCRGLCPHCGINLNLASCGCREGHVDDRLAVLKKLKF
jgi:uncharacterized protein